MVEQAFRTVKSVLATRPAYHDCDATTRGRVFFGPLFRLL